MFWKGGAQGRVAGCAVAVTHLCCGLRVVDFWELSGSSGGYECGGGGTEAEQAVAQALVGSQVLDTCMVHTALRLTFKWQIRIFESLVVF
jgi:hypothetical protein